MASTAAPDPVSHQSLYRRFRPQRFDEVLGQEHVSLALRNAVRDGRTGHAYLFSGPRGTGKTSTARILAKALNCADPVDGEPCGVCASCVEIARGASMDVHELDAASNNGVEAIRDLVAHSALGTPGRWKIYIVDEVHMLSTAASNALLKTLEEPPRHVVFVLATTDAQKVLPTIRSRTQHFEFRLLGPEVLSGLLRRVSEQAGLGIGDDALESSVRRGRGSARDALSALDQVAAGGTLRDEIEALAEIAEALADRDASALLVGLARVFDAGLDAQRLAAELADYLRQGFLAMLSPELVSVTGAERARVEETARRMGLPALVRAMENFGRAMVDMRESPDARVHLESTLIRLAHPEMDDSAAALLERVQRLERALSESLSEGSTTSTGTARPASDETPTPRRQATATTPKRGSGTRDDEGRRSSSGASTGTSGDRGVSGSAPEEVAGKTGRADGGLSSSLAVQPEGDPSAEPFPESGPGLARRALSELGQTRVSASRAPGPSHGESPSQIQPAVSGPRSAAPAAAASPATAPSPSAAPATATFPTRDELVQVWGDEVLAGLPARARVRFKVGRFVAADGGAAVFALPNQTHMSYCEELRPDVERALSVRFGTPVPLELMVDPEPADDSDSSTGAGRPRHVAKQSATSGAPPGALAERVLGTEVDEADHEPDLLDPAVLEAETEPAGAGPSPEERIKLAFPGAVEV